MTALFNNLYFIPNNDQTDPALNLALEEYAVRNLPPENNYLLIYSNQPSVIIGKHQNVAEEVNLSYCAKNNIPVLRRISGGGTVFHDSGNLNFSFITAHTLKNFNNYHKFIQPILEILYQACSDVELNSANNLVVKGKKISGNAQFTSLGRMISHGTLLFDSNLDNLRNSLKINPASRFESRSTKSKRASVANLSSFKAFKDYRISEFRQFFLRHLFESSILEYNLTDTDWMNIENLAKTKYGDWEWNYGRSPDCRISKTLRQGNKKIQLEIYLEKCRIREIRILGQLQFNDFAKQLIGKKI